MPLREVAFHEAGHLICAEYSARTVIPFGSKYNIDSIQVGGFSDVAIREKDLGQRNAIEDLVTVVCAGFAAERILSSRDPLAAKPNRSTSLPDFAFAQEQLRHAGINHSLDSYTDKAESVLREHWEKVELLANHMLTHHQGSVLKTMSQLEIFDQDKD